MLVSSCVSFFSKESVGVGTAFRTRDSSCGVGTVPASKVRRTRTLALDSRHHGVVDEMFPNTCSASQILNHVIL